MARTHALRDTTPRAPSDRRAPRFEIRAESLLGLQGFLGELSATATFEQAADATLAGMLQVIDAATRADYPDARLIRATVHVRPFDGYERLHPRGPVVATSRDRTPELSAPSQGAWEWISKRKTAVAFDVHDNAVLDTTGQVVDTLVSTARARLGTATVSRLRKEEATHVMVLPLTGPAGSVEGMIDLLIQCRRAIGTTFVWPACSHALEILAQLATPYLLALPLGEIPEVAPDELLPVIGPTMRARIELLERFAKTADTLLLTGPTGVGKSKLAHFCHARSRASAGPFESLDLSTVPEEIQLAELFGARRGAYTSLNHDLEGAVSRAKGGTLFIDEINKLSLRAQTALLKLIEDRVYRPLGTDRSRKVEARFIVGTNVDLKRAVENGQFLEDLYHRINVLPIRLPPLDERADEIADWARFMVDRRHRDEGLPPRGEARLTPEAVKRLEQHRWPGNLRALDNAIRRAYAHAAAPTEGDVVIDAIHVSNALNDEVSAWGTGADRDASLPAALVRAADLFIERSDPGTEGGAALDLDHARAFADLVLLRAVERLGGKRAALDRFVSPTERAHGNEGRRLKAALERLERLEIAAGGRMR